MIRIKEDVFVTDYPHLVSTTVFIEYDGEFFPDGQWTDFAYPILNTWASTIINNMDSQDAKFELYFMDGPYKVEAEKCVDVVTLRFIHFGQENVCEFTTQCRYSELMSAVYEAIKDFNYVLFKQGFHSGKFENVYNESVVMANKLKKTIQMSHE